MNEAVGHVMKPGNGTMVDFQPKSEEEIQAFKRIQARFTDQYDRDFSDKLSPKTILIVPSLSMDNVILSKIKGITHYEERLLCMLMLLRMPRTQVIYVTSMPIDPVIIDYYLHLLPGVTGHHAHQRLHLFSCYDSSSKPLTEKILERPRLLERIKKCIHPGHDAHMSCFNVTEFERTLAVKLDIPIYGCDPDLFELGNKSNSRKIFMECGLKMIDGYEDLYTMDEIIDALANLKGKHPDLKRAVVKINDGFSGEGNAIFSYEKLEGKEEIGKTIRKEFHARLEPVAELTVPDFLAKFGEMGGIVEIFIEGRIKTSPSVQCRITPKGPVVISTHDQELEDEGQVFLGAHFPANVEYAGELGSLGLRVAEALKSKGVLGRFSVDFLSVKEESKWTHFPIEINLRKGGTTHPYIMLQFLTDGNYDVENGQYFTASGQKRYYYCSDNLKSEQYHGITPYDLIDIAILHDLHFDGTLQEGVTFHLISALSQFGKLGVVCIGSTPERADYFYKRTVEILQLETVKQAYTH